jgi:uncharacterized membrane protein
MVTKTNIFEIVNRVLHPVGGLIAVYGLWKFDWNAVGIGLIALISGHLTYLLMLILQEKRGGQKTGKQDKAGKKLKKKRGK